MTKKLNRRDFLKLSALTAAGLAAVACAKTPTERPEPTVTPTLPVTETPTVEATWTPTSARAPTSTWTPTSTRAQRPTDTVTVAPSMTPSPIPSATPSPTVTTAAPGFFSLHPFIEAHPEAVFIKRTNVAVKTDAQAKQREGREWAREVFTLGDRAGIPLSHKIAIKANLTCASGFGNTDEGMGILTDKSFVEGLIEGMVGLGFPASNMYMREGNWLADGYCPSDHLSTGYVELAERIGIHLLDFPTGRVINELSLDALQEGTEVIWKECPDGVMFKRIGYVAPFNQSDTWLLDVAKFKAHSMGMTLCVKNLQGMCITPYIRFCEGVDATLKRPQYILQDFQPNLEERIARLHAQHVQAGIPRWDRPGRDWTGGYGMEAWAQRTCDSHSVTDVGFCLIEGIYGRNGNAFMEGPGPDGKAQDFMTNVLIFGKNPFRVDIVGTWLAGHEPGNFGLFHIARERGLVTVLNPMDIPLYLWNGGTPQRTPLTDLGRVPLKTPYLRRDYNGQDEPPYHMVDEPFDY